MLADAVQVSWVRIDRDAYLRAALGRHCREEQLGRAIDESPAAAGIPLEILHKVAGESIRYETAKATAISTGTGIPGGLAMFGTVPADMAQSFAHMLRIAQKLAYLFSWPDLFSGDGNGMNDATKSQLTLFLGVMYGTQGANIGVEKVASRIAARALHELPRKALTKGVIYPIVKKVALRLGYEMTKPIFAKFVAESIPVVGAVLSGGLTFGTFHPMCHRLKTQLSSLELTMPRPDMPA